MKRESVQVASRAIALYLILVSVGNMAAVPPVAFAVWHYATLPASSGQDYGLKFYLIDLVSRVCLSIGLFICALWISRLGPKIERFLSPSQAD
jgi:hypothetical protein